MLELSNQEFKKKKALINILRASKPSTGLNRLYAKTEGKCKKIDGNSKGEF